MLTKRPAYVPAKFLSLSLLCSTLIASFVLLPLLTAEEVSEPKLFFKFGAIADCQYCDADGAWRQYRRSPQKLRECIADFNSQSLTHVVHLGDFIDRDWESFDVVIPIIEKSKAPVRHVLGNHDFSVEDRFKELVPGRLGLEGRYYSFSVMNWRILVLDTNDLSLYAHAKGTAEYVQSLGIYEALGGDLPKYNGGIGATQLEWLEKELVAADLAGQRVMLHSHHPVYPPGSHNAWNADEVVSLLERHDCVAVYMNGHNHRGAYGYKKGIHYVTLKGMVDTEETAYSVVSVFEDRIAVKGSGRQDDLSLEF
ncbi:MAG TPA: hypothetical protein DIV79_01735 [Opitutae bacterium]|nr:hypothetical protein [Opitutaceae bacterium]HCR28723.1 hypothetical protein [Opitutae bacterium]|tara:strand:- start:770 stop:1699 length:930 start_codon:yes stop_codon:yes gene_type:complete